MCFLCVICAAVCVVWALCRPDRRSDTVRPSLRFLWCVLYSRSAEIILCPYIYEGVWSYGEYVYDYSDDTKKVDQIYYTGNGDSQFYSHEMGHMLMSCAAILNGWNATCSTWESYSSFDSSKPPWASVLY